MSNHIIIVDQLKDWHPEFPEANVISTQQYLASPEHYRERNVRVINLSRSYRYLSTGYYCSLLAEARRQKVLPSVRTITNISSKAIYSLNMDFTLGELTIFFNLFLIAAQIAVARKRYSWFQLIQLPAVILLGYFIDITLSLVSFIGTWEEFREKIDGIGELRRMSRGEGDHGVRTAVERGQHRRGGGAGRRVRIDDHAGRVVHSGHLGERRKETAVGAVVIGEYPALAVQGLHQVEHGPQQIGRLQVGNFPTDPAINLRQG